MKTTYDAIIIGFGKGGKTLAGYLARKDKSVAMIEKSEHMYGGTCINTGCIPTKSLIDSAQRAVVLHPAAFAEKAALYAQAISAKTSLVEKLRAKNYHMLADQENITIYHGTASFKDAHTVCITNEKDFLELSAAQIFINTGSSPFIPPIEGLQNSMHVYLSETILNLRELPKELVIVGGGYIGLEYASFYTMFGTQVTILQNTADFIPREDHDISSAVYDEMLRQGIRIIFKADIQRISEQKELAVIEYEQDHQTHTISANAILIATGRRPNINELNLAAAGIAVSPRGGIQTDAQRRTSQPHIWAMGDVTGGPQFTYVSLDDFRIVRASLEGGAYQDNARNIPYSVFIEPPLSRAGLTEQEALARGLDFVIAKLPVAAIPKAHVLKRPQGLLKAIVDKKTQKILGASLFCPESHELINLIKLAMDADLSYTFLRDQIFTHPTMGEALNDLFGMIEH